MFTSPLKHYSLAGDSSTLLYTTMEPASPTSSIPSTLCSDREYERPRILKFIAWHKRRLLRQRWWMWSYVVAMVRINKKILHAELQFIHNDKIMDTKMISPEKTVELFRMDQVKNDIWEQILFHKQAVYCHQHNIELWQNQLDQIDWFNDLV